MGSMCVVQGGYGDDVTMAEGMDGDMAVLQAAELPLDMAPEPLGMAPEPLLSEDSHAEQEVPELEGEEPAAAGVPPAAASSGNVILGVNENGDTVLAEGSIFCDQGVAPGSGGAVCEPGTVCRQPVEFPDTVDAPTRCERPDTLGEDADGNTILVEGSRGCTEDGFVCEEGTICFSPFPAPSECSRKAGVGEPCQPQRRSLGSCSGDLVCVDLTGEAVFSPFGALLAGAGGATECQEPIVVEDGTNCRDLTVPAVCGEDSFCSVPEVCNAENSCIGDGFCTPKPKEGEPCARGLFGGGVCISDELECLNESGELAEGNGSAAPPIDLTGFTCQLPA